MESEYERLFGNCCRKLCKTEEMNDNEFDEYTGNHCEDCPIGELVNYYNKRTGKLKHNLYRKIEELYNTIKSNNY